MAVVPAPAGATHERGGARFTSLATPTSGSVDTSVWLVEVEPGTPATPHELTREEVFVVLSGRAAVYLAGARQTAEAGDAIVVPAGVSFSLAPDGHEPLRAQCCFPVGGQALAGRRPTLHPALGAVSRSDAVPLARLFAMAFRLLIDGLHEQLAARGWTGLRPAFGFVLLALRDGPASLRELTATLGTTKQAVSKLVDGMVEAGYAERTVDPADARAKQVRLTDRGRDLLGAVEEIYRDLEAGWAQTLGEAAVESLRRDLETVLRATHGGALPAVRPTT